MGLVSRNGSGIRQLLLFRQAVAYEEAEQPGEVDVIATVEGYVADVRCSLCGQIRTWVPGPEAIAHLIEQAAQQKMMLRAHE